MTPPAIAQNFLQTVGCLFGYVVYLLLILFPSVILGLILTYTVKTLFKARMTMDYFPADEIFQTGVAYFLFLGLIYFLFACWYLLGIPIQAGVLKELWSKNYDITTALGSTNLLPQSCSVVTGTDNSAGSNSLNTAPSIYIMLFVFHLCVIFSRIFIIFAPIITLFYIGARSIGSARMKIKDEGVGPIPAYGSAFLSLFFAWILVAVLIITLGNIFHFVYWELVEWILTVPQ